jgi:hypothetical protein
MQKKEKEEVKIFFTYWNFIKPVNFRTFAAITFLVFYLMTVFYAELATSDLGYSKRFFINAVIFGLVFAFLFQFQLYRWSHRAEKMLIYATIAALFLGLPFFSS